MSVIDTEDTAEILAGLAASFGTGVGVLVGYPHGKAATITGALIGGLAFGLATRAIAKKALPPVNVVRRLP